jgi:hypothetical protein
MKSAITLFILASLFGFSAAWFIENGHQMFGVICLLHSVLLCAAGSAKAIINKAESL